MSWSAVGADPVGDLRRFMELAAVPQPVEVAEVEHQVIAWLCDRDREGAGRG